MCILSLVKTNDRLIITSNRDEQRSRKNSLTPEIISLENRKTILARDAQANGTWFLTDEKGRVAVLLNGAFENHTPRPPYRESRGIILINLFQEENFKSAFLFYNLENIEPFQIIFVENQMAIQCVWEGGQKHVFAIDLSSPKVFFSPTLYTKEQQEEKRNHFLNMHAEIGFLNPSELLNIHSNRNEATTSTNFFMSRENQTTKSISQVEITPTTTHYTHWQAWDNQLHEITLEHVVNV